MDLDPEPTRTPVPTRWCALTVAAVVGVLLEGPPTARGGAPVAPSFPALSTGIGRPTGIAIDAAGTIYVAAPDARRVFILDAAGKMAVIAAGDANAELRLVWNEQALYVAATVTDPDLRANGTGRDGALYDADSIEVMLDPDLTRGETATSDVFQVIASVTGALYDARGAGSTGDPTFDLAGLDAHAIAHGTITNHAITCIDMYVPRTS